MSCLAMPNLARRESSITNYRNLFFTANSANFTLFLPTLKSGGELVCICKWILR